MSNKIVIKGARTHNLKNLTVTIPRDKLIVITGVSGSGKSSLAFDTIYAEGQRRYVESLSTYARQFLDLQEKPEVDFIEGLSPAISIDQKTASRSPRSTVGTITEVYDYLRLLFAKIGTPVHPTSGRKLQQQSPSQMVDLINKWDDGEKFMILSPLVRDKKGEHKAVLNKIQQAGFVRLRVNGEVMTVNEEVELDPNRKHRIEIVVDRLTKTDYSRKNTKLSDGTEIEEKNDERLRLLDSIELALKFGEGLMIAHRVGDASDHLFSEHLSDPETGFSFPPLEPRLFSFNSPHGACQDCHGLGYRLELDSRLCFNPELSINEGGILPWASMGTNAQAWNISVLSAVGKKYHFTVDQPIKKLTDDQRQLILNGTGKESFTIKLQGFFSGRETSSLFEGVMIQTEKRYNDSDSDFVRKKLDDFMVKTPCPDCQGSRLNIYGRHVLLNEKNIFAITTMSIPEVYQWVKNIPVSSETQDIVTIIQTEISDRLSFLLNVGLGYLNLSRSANTLSGGEAQRIRLATQIGSRLQGVLYVLDEPSIGLHQRDNARLIHTLQNLRDLGNTVLVVEHDEETIRAADHLIEIGPQAGKHGGELVFSGLLSEMKNQSSETADFLFGRQAISIPPLRRRPLGQLSITNATENNLQGITVDLPLGVLVGITGVSGSGKSSLINRILVPHLAHKLNRAARKNLGACDAIVGVEQLDKLISIDQSPIGRTPRSNPATYTTVFTDIREVFAATPEARLRGYGPGRFSFNVKGGRCEACSGDGTKKIEMHFLPDVHVICEQCRGQRYNDETLEVAYRGKSVSEVLNMTVEEAVDFFQKFPSIMQKLNALMDVGLGYVALGQSSVTLSGGEAQRVKLASELMRTASGKTMYILDEPTTGLHFSDVQKLLHVLQKLVDKGNSVIIIEHNLDIIKSCDYLVDLGPEGGDGGGTLVAKGTPEEVSQVKKSHTGQFLQPFFPVS